MLFRDVKVAAEHHRKQPTMQPTLSFGSIDRAKSISGHSKKRRRSKSSPSNIAFNFDRVFG
jgi:hypothetical protein